jgi:hypothetical protein
MLLLAGLGGPGHGADPKIPGGPIKVCHPCAGNPREGIKRWSDAAEHPRPSTSRPPLWRGVFFNPQLHSDPNFPWLIYYEQYRPQVRTALAELVNVVGINLVDLFILIPHTLQHPPQGNRAGQPLEEWANVSFLNNVATFVDDCHEVGLSVEFDLVDNRWIPYSLDSAHHIGRPGNPWWPVADDTSWDEAATWYGQVIEYVEAHAAHPESIALWCMMGNYSLGAAEPVLWDDDGNPAIKSATEQFVKRVWPSFRAAGRRPKAAPILLPIFSNNAYWQAKPPMVRLSAFTNLKKWLIDDLALPPDYWIMSTYPFCDPGPDGFPYLRTIIDILGPQNASRILSTDLKGPGHDDEWRDQILPIAGHSGPEILAWHFEKCAQYGLAGGWIWAYQDTPTSPSGIRTLDGRWKEDLLEVIRAQR